MPSRCVWCTSDVCHRIPGQRIPSNPPPSHTRDPYPQQVLGPSWEPLSKAHSSFWQMKENIKPIQTTEIKWVPRANIKQTLFHRYYLIKGREGLQADTVFWATSESSQNGIVGSVDRNRWAEFKTSPPKAHGPGLGSVDIPAELRTAPGIEWMNAGPPEISHRCWPQS